ncbi:MAG: DEAD/DEAH box helicase [Alphaproteobacteria bacterium]|nr:DEAD/DEAH box helicase [Rickettsiales bacterium]
MKEKLSSDILNNIAGYEFFNKLCEIFGNSPNVADIVTCLPASYELELSTQNLVSVPIGSIVTMKVTIVAHGKFISYRRNFGRKTMYQISAFTDSKEPILLCFFKIYPTQITKFTVGKTNIISGKLEIIDKQYRIIHPQIVNKNVEGIKVLTRWSSILRQSANKSDECDKNDKKSYQSLSVNLTEEQKWFVKEIEKQNNVPIMPLYLIPKQIKQSDYYEVVQKSLNYLKEDLEIIKCKNVTSFNGNNKNLYTMFKAIHQPESITCLKSLGQIKKNIAVMEIVANKIAILIADFKNKNTTKKPITHNCSFMKSIFKDLPFALTSDQNAAIKDITLDQSSTSVSSRLLQGDVGSGKTIVAIGAILNTIEAGGRAVFVAPTTILAMQHYRFISDLLLGTNKEVFLLTGKTKASERKRLYQAIDNNGANVIIGTHAIIVSENIVNYNFCIIDEQHRFGVRQRAILSEKNPQADILMMSATPIPRTILSVMYDNIKVSSVKQMPKSRKSIITKVMSDRKLDKLITALSNNIEDKNVKAYWICPAVDVTDDDSGIVSVEERFKSLQKCIAKDKLFIIHGKLKEHQKDKIMLEFTNAKHGALLVATSVIEVGIDVPEATVIVIEQSHRFGLSQLHQLRGRVGRGVTQSYCLLLYTANCNPDSLKKLSIIRSSTDGFYISEEDFKMRGAGDLIGFRQSGYSNFKIANTELDIDSFNVAKKISQEMTNNKHSDQIDKTHTDNLLSLFGYTDEMFKLLGK